MLLTRAFSHLASAYLLAVLLALCAPDVLAAPQAGGEPTADSGSPTGVGPPRGCGPNLDRRKEWRNLSTKQKRDWHRAVLCLHGRPATSNWGGATTRFEQYQAVHAQLGMAIHLVGHFLPWHRQIVTMFNNELRTVCGYDGPTPYWDWAMDADSPAPIGSSPVFNAATGFGGDGVPGTYTPPPGDMVAGRWTGKGCIADGPYKDMRINVGPGAFITNHCIARGFDETRRANFTSAAVARALGEPTMAAFIARIDQRTERGFDGIHGGPHYFVGGEMGNGNSSPGDPIFYLHHAALDRVWWRWQQADRANRLFQVAGFTSVADPVVPTTLDYVMTFPGLGPNVTVREVMDSTSRPGCFTY